MTWKRPLFGRIVYSPRTLAIRLPLVTVARTVHQPRNVLLTSSSLGSGQQRQDKEEERSERRLGLEQHRPEGHTPCEEMGGRVPPSRHPRNPTYPQALRSGGAPQPPSTFQAVLHCVGPLLPSRRSLRSSSVVVRKQDPVEVDVWCRMRWCQVDDFSRPPLDLRISATTRQGGGAERATSWTGAMTLESTCLQGDGGRVPPPDIQKTSGSGGLEAASQRPQPSTSSSLLCSFPPSHPHGALAPFGWSCAAEILGRQKDCQFSPSPTHHTHPTSPQ